MDQRPDYFRLWQLVSRRGELSPTGKPDCAPLGLKRRVTAVLDFNGDGNLDLVVANYPYSVAMADFNGDTVLDLAVVWYDYAKQTTVVGILLGNGDGTFQAAQTFAAGPVTPYHVAVGDFNRDGFADLVVGGRAVLLGNGDGTFQAAQDYLVGSPLVAAVGDFNGDGFPDLATGGEGGVTILLNAADWGR